MEQEKMILWRLKWRARHVTKKEAWYTGTTPNELLWKHKDVAPHVDLPVGMHYLGLTS